MKNINKVFLVWIKHEVIEENQKEVFINKPKDWCNCKDKKLTDPPGQGIFGRSSGPGIFGATRMTSQFGKQPESCKNWKKNKVGLFSNQLDKWVCNLKNTQTLFGSSSSSSIFGEASMPALLTRQPTLCKHWGKKKQSIFGGISDACNCTKNYVSSRIEVGPSSSLFAVPDSKVPFNVFSTPKESNKHNK